MDDRLERAVNDDMANDRFTAGDRFATEVDEEIVIDVPGCEAGATVSSVNGMPIATAAPADVGGAWVQLREDGRLTVSPNAGFAGRVAFEYVVVGTDARPVMQRAVVDVVGDPGGAALAESNSLASDSKLAEIASGDIAQDTGALAEAGLYADMFKIVGNSLYLRAGVEFDFGAKSSLSIDIFGEPAPEIGHEHEGKTLLSDLAGDMFIFMPGYARTDDKPDDVPREVIDLSFSGHATFQDLLDSGALVQDGPDVVLTIDPDDPSHSDKITLRGVELAALSDSDFKF